MFHLFHRKSKAEAVREVGSNTADAASKFASQAVEAAAQAAERAVDVALKARKASGPLIRSGAHSAAGTLGTAAERAAVVLAETADKLAQSGDVASGASATARQKLADASEAFADAVRPKRRHRIRKLLLISALTGGIVAFVKSPLKRKVSDKLAHMCYGTDMSEDEPSAITLPRESDHSKTDRPESRPTGAGSAATNGRATTVHERDEPTVKS